MLTIVCEQPGVLKAENRAKPVRRDGEILVRIERVGVCGTDLHIFAGNQPYLSYPRVMGHELAGVAAEVPDDSDVKAGDVVYLIPYLSCGTCRACGRGRPNCCAHLQVLGVHRDGGMVEYLSVPAQFVRPAAGVSLDDAAMVEFLAIGAHAVRRSACGPGDRVLVTGAGPIGIATALFARLRGAEVTVLDSRRDRLEFCVTHLGIAAAVTVGPGDTDALARQSGGDFFDVVFDATGSAAAMERGFAFVAQGGTYVLVSLVSSDIRFSDPEFHKRETTLLASRNATVVDFETVLDAMRAGQVPTAALATHRFPLADAPDRFASLLDPAQAVVKAVLHL